MTQFHLTGDALWERMDRAVERVRQRLERATTALETAGIPYAIVGGSAVRAWVAQADEAAVRTAKDVELLIRRSDLLAVRDALQAAGFVHRNVASLDLFLDGPEAKVRDAVRVLFAGEKVAASDPYPAPDIGDVEVIENHATLNLEALVRMKLVAFRIEDSVHLRDMLDVGLIDPSWCSRFPPELAARLQELIDNPNG